jgi:hypothetical protein
MPFSLEARLVILTRWLDRLHAPVRKSLRFFIHFHNLPQKQEIPSNCRLFSRCCSAEHQEEAVGFAVLEIKDILERAARNTCPFVYVRPFFGTRVLLRNGRFNSLVLC